jgi:hypothetical protein
MVDPGMKGIYWLMLIVIAAWLLILLESYIFFAVIQPLGPPIHVGPLPSTLAKISGTIGLAVLWFVATLSLRALYLRSRELKFPSGVS